MLDASDELRCEALDAVAEALHDAAGDILAANALDLAADVPDELRQRLQLDADSLAAAIAGVRQVARLPDPVGQTLRATSLDAGLDLWQLTCPIGVVAAIFEARPEACIQIPALTLRTGNAVLLKGGVEATHSNQAIVDVVRRAIDGILPVDAVQLLDGRREVNELLAMDDLVDLIVPRGGTALVRHVQDNTRIPVLGHASGVCHIYVHADADLERATSLILDSKLDHPSACNAVETVLVHTAVPWLDALRQRLTDGGIVLHERDARPGTEYGTPDLNLVVVAGMDEAVAHIEQFGSGHTDAIITNDDGAARRFMARVDSAGVFVNASTRFADGRRYGLGAELGISTGKIHARGPVGVDGLVTTRWILMGDGHVVNGRTRSYDHRPGPPFGRGLHG